MCLPFENPDASRKLEFGSKGLSEAISDASLLGHTMNRCYSQDLKKDFNCQFEMRIVLGEDPQLPHSNQQIEFLEIQLILEDGTRITHLLPSYSNAQFEVFRHTLNPNSPFLNVHMHDSIDKEGHLPKELLGSFFYFQKHENELLRMTALSFSTWMRVRRSFSPATEKKLAPPGADKEKDPNSTSIDSWLEPSSKCQIVKAPANSGNKIGWILHSRDQDVAEILKLEEQVTYFSRCAE